jgi:hypothetical protein
MLSIIPTQPKNQKFQVSLNNVTYIIQLVFRVDTWFMDLSDENGVSILAGVPLVTGSDLLAQYHYLGLGGMLQVASSGSNPDATPTFDGLGTQSQLYWT